MVRVKVKKIDIHNFLSFEDEEWDFSNTSRLVLVKGVNKDTESTLGNTSNGSGKSAWSHALMYALFGQLSGKIHNSNLKNKYLDKLRDGWKMSVAVEVDTILSNTNVKAWKIVRGIQKGSSTVVLQLFELDENNEWKDISKSTSANTQKFIEDNVLFMNFEMYQRLVMLSVDDKYNFFKLNASQKRDFVETLFDTSIYSKMYKLMGDDMKAKNMVLQNLKVNQVKFAKTKEVCEESIERYKASVNDQIAETNREKKELEEKVEGFDPKFQEIAEQQKVVQEALEKIRENKGKLDDIISKCNDVMTSARIEINNHETTISHHQRELNKHKEVLGMICEDCKNVVNKFYSLDVYRTEIDKLNSQIEEEKGKIENCTKQIAKVKVYDDKLKAAEMAKMGELSETQVEERNLQFQKSQLLKSIKELERKVADLVDSMENEDKIPSYDVYKQTLKDIEEVEQELKDESMRLCLLKIGSEIVSPDAIKRNIISRVVSSINAMINANLSELCVNFTCNLTNDMNDYEIQSSGGELDFPNLSLGEQMKLIISSQLAFRKFLISRFNVCMNIMIIDEVVDRALDSVSIQKLLGILLQLSQKENTNISIISHRGEVETMFKDMPETQMMVVQKQDNISKIVRD
jgi:DNA repair exonuclease SbcCD ATPase subunit